MPDIEKTVNVQRKNTSQKSGELLLKTIFKSYKNVWLLQSEI